MARHPRSPRSQRRAGARRPGSARAIACWLCLGAVLLLSFVACRFPGSVRPTVKIGLVAPFEGRYRYVGYDVIYAVRLALEEANEAGGVCGYGIELVAYDDGADPSMAREQARKLDVDPDVVAALGHFRQATTAAAAGTYAQTGLSLLAPTDLSPTLTMPEGVHLPGPSADCLAGPLLDRAVERARGDTIVLMGNGGALTEALLRAAQRRDVGLVTVPDTEDGWAREVIAHGPAALLLDLDPVRAGEVVSALRQRGWAGDVLGGPALAAADFVAVADGAATDAALLTPWPFPPDVPGGEAFAAAYRDVANGGAPGPLALPAYEGTRMLLEAIEEAAAQGAPTRQRVASALADLERNRRIGQADQLCRPVVASDDRGEAEVELVWYRIGPDGVPRLMEKISPAQLIDR